MTSLALKSFVRLMPKQGHDEWKGLVEKMRRFCVDMEYEMLKAGHKRAATAHIGEGDYEKTMEKINRDGFIFTPIMKVAETEGHSHIRKKPKEGEPFTWYGCITKSHKEGQDFKKADGGASNEKPDHKKIGELLGYPDCCVDYYEKNARENYDPIWVKKSGSVEGYPECNRLLRYFGVQISSHFTCSPKCENSKKLGEEWLSLARKKDKELTEKLYELLSTEMTWDSYHGVVQIETPYFVGVADTFPYLEKKRIINWKSVNK